MGHSNLRSVWGGQKERRGRKEPREEGEEKGKEGKRTETKKHKSKFLSQKIA